MRARLTLILTITAVLLSLVPVAPASAAPPRAFTGRAGWFSSSTARLEQRIQLVARVRQAERARFAAVARKLTTPPPPPPPLPPPPPPTASDPASFLWPAQGPITSPFGRRWGRAHTGVDIDAPAGAPIVAAQAGAVVLAGWKNGYGQTVVIDHGEGLTTLYAHQAALLVGVGQRVERGQRIGTVGATGNVTAAHLHYEVLAGGVPRNPAGWLP